MIAHITKKKLPCLKIYPTLPLLAGSAVPEEKKMNHKHTDREHNLKRGYLKTHFRKGDFSRNTQFNWICEEKEFNRHETFGKTL